jgi:oligopeptide transport system substrate-binding protein
VKKTLALLLALCMVLMSCVALADDTEVAYDTYTYHAYTTSLGNCWNPHTWETNAEDAVNGYITSPFVSMQILDSENGVYQWTYEMAESVTDVTADHQDDLTKYPVTLQEGKTAEDTTEGFVFEIKLNEKACWENGEPITADTYIESMKLLLAPEMKNYRANLYYAGESAVAGGAEFYFQGDIAYLPIGMATSDYLANGSVDDLYIDCWGFWGAEGYVDAEGNEVPQYVSVSDEVAYSADGAGDDEFSGKGLYDEYFAPGAPYESYAADYVCNTQAYEDNVDYDATVGCYKVDDYTIRYVNATYIDFNYFLTSLTSTWLVYEPLYTAGLDTSGSLVTTDYCTSKETTMAYGPYRIESLQEGKQIVYVQNENWYGYEKQEDGSLLSITPYEVDGEQIQRYQTTSIVVDVMDNAAAKQAFLKGELTSWTPEADDLLTYATSDQLYKVDETYTMSFFFNTNLDMLKAMDESKGNTNSVVLSNDTFRRAMSLAIDRAEYVTATEGYKPAYAIMNNLYFYDVYNDPTSSYRNSDEAMEAIVNLYEVEYGEGTPYATLRDAYLSINGYNLTEAKELFTQACTELVADGLYTEGDPIHVRIGWAKGALQASDTKVVEILNKQLNTALEGTGFGTIELEPIGNINNRYDAVPAGEYAIGYGAWGGAAFYPFRNFQVYCDPEQYSINEAADWDPTTETLTISIDGEDVTMTWQAWSRAMIGSGPYSAADFETKLHITAVMEEEYLKKFYRIPLAGTTSCELLAYQVSYYTEDYNIMYGFGGLELMSYNYTDAEWAEYVAEEGGVLSYE